MERKFASKLSQRPAAEARKLASSQLKETIQSNKLKTIEPIDFDTYIEQNLTNLRKDPCSRQLILLPNDDIYADDYFLNESNEQSANGLGDKTQLEQIKEQNEESSVSTIQNESSQLTLTLKQQDSSIILNNKSNLFVNDCLQTYFNKKYEIKYKYHVFGGNYRQLPDYHINRDAKCKIDSLVYEVDMDDVPNKNNSIIETLFAASTNYNHQNYTNHLNKKHSNKTFEKHGWLNYKLITNSFNNSEKSTNFKRRYFHLRCGVVSPLPSRQNSIECKKSSASTNQSTNASQREKTKSLNYKQKAMTIVTTPETAQNHLHREVYLLECFKEVPGLKRNENPKHQIIFDQNVMNIKDVSNKTTSFTFEITESIPSTKQNSTLPSSLQNRQSLNGIIQTHVFIADNQKQFEEWFNVLESVIFNQSSTQLRNISKNATSLINLKEEKTSSNGSKIDDKKSKHMSVTLLSSSTTSASSVSSSLHTSSPPSSMAPDSSVTHSSSNLNNLNKEVSIAKPEDVQSAYLLNESADDSSEASMSAARLALDQFKIMNDANQRFVDSFDLNKYLNENDEDLKCSGQTPTQSKPDQLNIFDMYPSMDNDHLIDEETELNCIWPEKQFGRTLLVEFSNFKLNLNLPVSLITQLPPSVSISSVKTNSFSSASTTNASQSSEVTAINPELFYLAFSLYDSLNNQKLSENFYWVPNLDKYLHQSQRQRQSIGNASSNNITSIHKSSSNTLLSKSTNGLSMLTNHFSLDGKHLIFDGVNSNIDALLKMNATSFLTKISKALFDVLDVHDNIYLVARIEKILDGSAVHSSIQPYLLQMNETNKVKAAIKLNKKLNQLIRTKLATYRQPFAWAAKPIYKKVNDKHKTTSVTYELDNDAQFQIFAQDAHHLSDDDLYKYLNDFRTKDKYLNKLTLINGELRVTVNDLPIDVLDDVNKCALLRKSTVINSSFNIDQNVIKLIINNDLSNNKDLVLKLDTFDPILGVDNSAIINSFSTQLLQYSPTKTSSGKFFSSNSQQTSKSNASTSSNGNDYKKQTETTNGDSTKANGIHVNTNSITEMPLQVEQKEILKKARLLTANTEFKSYLYVYPKSLKYDTQKTFSRARNILLKIELREKDVSEEGCSLRSILKLTPQITKNLENNLFVSSYSTIISYHNKNPQFYDEIKILLPMNLNDKHHLLFKFYHVSCTNAKSQTCSNVINDILNEHGESSSTNLNSNDSHSVMRSDSNGTINAVNNVNSSKMIESLIGYAWLPIFKSGRLFNGEKQLPLAQNLVNNYLSYEKIGMGQSIGPNDIKWIENQKQLFKVSIVAQSTVHTTDPHVANFYTQCEKLANLIGHSKPTSEQTSSGAITPYLHNPTKRKAPILDKQQVSSSQETTLDKEALNFEGEIKINLANPNKEVIRNSFKALHATDITTIIKYLPTLLNRILNTLITTVSGDVAIHSVRALIHFVWQVTSIGKIENLKAFIKYIFFVDYTNHFTNDNTTATIHDELMSNLVILTKQNIPLQDVVQMNRLLKNCWFFLEITLKSVCLYTIQFKRFHKNSNKKPTFDDSFYSSLKNFYELLVDLIVKYGNATTTSIQSALVSSNASNKELDLLNSFKSCNRSLAMFVKKSLNVLNRKFLFCLINRYLESFHLCDKQLFQIKYDFIRIICNHEHFIAFSLPYRRAVSNITEFAEEDEDEEMLKLGEEIIKNDEINNTNEIKYEFVLSDQFRSTHFLVGVILSQLCIALNDNKEQRKLAINIFRNILCKHSYDSRYKSDKIKNARISTLYLPLIDILLENLPRLTGNQQQSQNILKGNKSLCNESSTTSFSSRVTSQNTLTQSSNLGVIASNSNINSSASISNGYVNSNIENGHSRQSEASSSVLGVIAGIVNPNKLQDHLDSVIGMGSGVGLMSDTDSLSSADDHHFIKNINANKRTSSSLITSSTANSDNAANMSQMNQSNSVNLNSIISNHNGSNTNETTTTSSTIRSYNVIRKDKLDSSEMKDLLICLVFILRNTSEDALLGLWYNYDENEFFDFLTLLELCLRTFKYRGKSNIQKLNAISKGQDIKALIKSPRSYGDQVVSRNNLELLEKIANGSVVTNGNKKHDDAINNTNNRTSSPIFNGSTDPNSNSNQIILNEANLCHQVAMVVMNILSMILIHQKDKICDNHGDNQITKKLIEIYFQLLETNQSEDIKLKVFVSLRMLINKTSTIFLEGPSSLCSSLCLELLKCFNSKMHSVNVEACVALYLLMRKNYEYTKQKSIARVHSQTIISVSQLIGNMKLTSSYEVIDCLSILNNLAFNDQTFQNTRFSLEVDDLTKRIRNIFMATSQMKTFQDDIEMLIDSQYCLAKSYANSIELRRTWLDSMAEIHFKESNYSEAAHCYLHVAALIAENLKHQGLYTLGCTVFKKITPNIELEEEINKNDDIMANGDVYSMSGLNEIQYTMTQLIDYLNKSAEMFKMGERYDILPDIFKLAAAIHEPRDYEHLKQIYQNIEKAYEIMAERDQRAREKPLGAYYRVSFFGKMFQDQNNKVYIYKEPGNTKLFEICDRLRKIYSKRFGSSDLVEILNDNRKPTELKLDTNYKNYIQVTYVQPYFDETELDNRISYFDRNNNLKKFYYETSYQLKEENANNGTDNDLPTQQHAELLRLCKRKTILETSHWFPYVKKRILVVYEMQIDLNPLETAIDELKQKIEDFELILKKRDITLLELYLQGGIIPQVHKGPLAYAEAFLEPTELNSKYSKDLKKKFKITFKRLIDLYQKGIDLYGQLANKHNHHRNNLQNINEDNNPNSSNKQPTTSNTNNNNSNTNNQQNTAANSSKYIEMHRLLQEKFNEVENSFRNLLLIDGVRSDICKNSSSKDDFDEITSF